jgi:hypothetical protein
MERFNYPNIAAVEAEDVEILQLLEAESWGKKMDDEEELAAREQEMENNRMKAGHGQ